MITRSLYDIKLASSGLTADDAELLHIQHLSAIDVQTLSDTHPRAEAVYLPYYSPLGPPLSDVPLGTPYYRLRYLAYPHGMSDAGKKKFPKYTQPRGTLPVAYYPTNIDWSRVLQDHTVPIFMTEGELKAAKACKHGFATIGLGGVTSFRARKKGVEWLESLTYPLYIRRNIYIIFDSDLKTNPMVISAAKSLADELSKRGAYPYMITLDEVPHIPKTGLDDYLVHHAGSEAIKMREMVETATPIGLVEQLFTYNDKYVYTAHPGCIVNRKTLRKIPVNAFTGHLEVNKVVTERNVSKDGDVTYKQMTAGTAWLKWPLRYETDELGYLPGGPAHMEIDNGMTAYNMWSGWGVTPKKGDAGPWLEMIAYLFERADPAGAHWLQQWLAYPIQYPGTKLHTAVLLQSIRHGTGKSTIGYAMSMIYGQNFTELNLKELRSAHNEWSDAKQFVLIDDVKASSNVDEMNSLQKLITQKNIRLNPKYISSYIVKDTINYLITSNQSDALHLQDDDRRMFIHDVKSKPKPDAFYTAFARWLDGDGAAIVMQHLLDYDLTGFNPYGHALYTSAKKQMITDSYSDIGMWVREFLADPDAMIKGTTIPPGRELVSSKELHMIYDPEGRTRVTANGITREFRRVGVDRVDNGQPIPAPDGSQCRYLPIKRVGYWLTEATRKDIGEHIAHYHTTTPKSF